MVLSDSQPTGSVSGRLVDHRAQPVGEQFVRLVELKNGRSVGMISESAGAFGFKGVPPGAYRLEGFFESLPNFRVLSELRIRDGRVVELGDVVVGGLGELSLDFGAASMDLILAAAPRLLDAQGGVVFEFAKSNLERAPFELGAGHYHLVLGGRDVAAYSDALKIVAGELTVVEVELVEQAGQVWTLAFPPHLDLSAPRVCIRDDSGFEVMGATVAISAPGSLEIRAALRPGTWEFVVFTVAGGELTQFVDVRVDDDGPQVIHFR